MDSFDAFRKRVIKEGLKLISDPRVSKWMKDERFTKAVITMMSVPGRVNEFTTEQMERMAKAMSLATQDELKDLRRTVRRLEDELLRMEDEQKDEREAKKKP